MLTITSGNFASGQIGAAVAAGLCSDFLVPDLQTLSSPDHVFPAFCVALECTAYAAPQYFHWSKSHGKGLVLLHTHMYDFKCNLFIYLVKLEKCILTKLFLISVNAIDGLKNKVNCP